MNTPAKCAMGNRCIVHGFKETASRLLVARAFQKIVDVNFTIDEQRYFWSVAHGKR